MALAVDGITDTPTPDVLGIVLQLSVKPTTCLQRPLGGRPLGHGQKIFPTRLQAHFPSRRRKSLTLLQAQRALKVQAPQTLGPNVTTPRVRVGYA